MIEVGRLIMKIAGRDAGKYGLIVEVVDDNYVIIDGQVRRRKVNIKHIEPLLPKLDIQKGASHEAVVDALKKLDVEVVDSKPKPQKPKPVKNRTLKITENKKEKEEKSKKVKPTVKKADKKDSGKEEKVVEAPVKEE